MLARAAQEAGVVAAWEAFVFLAAAAAAAGEGAG